jgi:hypothetical protein
MFGQRFHPARAEIGAVSRLRGYWVLLASADSSFVTGIELAVDGGMAQI